MKPLSAWEHVANARSRAIRAIDRYIETGTREAYLDVEVSVTTARQEFVDRVRAHRKPGAHK